MSLQDEISKRIKEEIDKDPYNLGYSKMTDTEIKEKLNVTFAIITSSETIMSAPINRILAGLESAPNAILEDTDITRAKVFVIQPIVEI